MRRLTVEALRKMRPGARFKDHVPGLVARRSPEGRRTFVFRVREGKVTLGEINLDDDVGTDELEAHSRLRLTLTDARALATRMWRDRARGVDVLARPDRAPEGITFERVAREFIEQHAKRTTRRWRETAALLGIGDDGKPIAGSLADRWRTTAIAALDGDTLHQVIDESVESGVPGRAVRTPGPSDARGRALGRTLSALFGWALKRKRYVRVNPMTGVHIPAPDAPRERSLNDAEIAALWPALDAAGDPASCVLKVLLLTGQRLREISEMRHDEIVDDVLHLPGSRTKSRRPHKVPLSASVLALVEGAPRIAGSPFVFSLDGRVPVLIGAKVKARVDAKARLAPWRVHDLRRTVETHMAEMGIDGDLRDAILNHAKPGMRRVYDRSERLAERRVALERWAARVEEIVSGRRVDNVVRL